MCYHLGVLLRAPFLSILQCGEKQGSKLPVRLVS